MSFQMVIPPSATSWIFAEHKPNMKSKEREAQEMKSKESEGQISIIYDVEGQKEKSKKKKDRCEKACEFVSDMLGEVCLFLAAIVATFMVLFIVTVFGIILYQVFAKVVTDLTAGSEVQDLADVSKVQEPIVVPEAQAIKNMTKNITAVNEIVENVVDEAFNPVEFALDKLATEMVDGSVEKEILTRIDDKGYIDYQSYEEREKYMDEMEQEFKNIKESLFILHLFGQGVLRYEDESGAGGNAEKREVLEKQMSPPFYDHAEKSQSEPLMIRREAAEYYPESLQFNSRVYTPTFGPTKAIGTRDDISGYYGLDYGNYDLDGDGDRDFYCCIKKRETGKGDTKKVEVAVEDLKVDETEEATMAKRETAEDKIEAAVGDLAVKIIKELPWEKYIGSILGFEN